MVSMFSCYLHSKSVPPKWLRSAGFSIVEVVVTIGIITILTSLIMARYSAFDSAVLLKNQAYEIALDLREAQSYAISSRGFGNEFQEEYGLFFNQNSSPQEYIFWLDNGDTYPPRYQPGADELLETRALDQRFEIIDICVNGGTCGVVGVSVSYARPNFDALIVRGNGVAVNSVDIVIASVRDNSQTKTISVSSVGQITVQ